MKTTFRALLALALAALAVPAFGQTLSQNLPANTVVGRLGAGTSGPAQAIPLANLAVALNVAQTVSFQSLGAKCDGTTDDAAVIQDLLNKRPTSHWTSMVNGVLGVCAIGGDLRLLDGTWIQDASFKQLSPNASDRRTLRAVGKVGPFTLINVKVDRNGSPTDTGSPTGAAGIYISGTSGGTQVTGVYLEKVEVTGDGPGIGIIITDATAPIIINPYVHDMRYAATDDPCTEQLYGGWFIRTSRATLVNPKIENLTGTITNGVPSGACTTGSTSSGGVSRAYQTDGWDFAGVTDSQVFGSEISNVGEGFDTGGSIANDNLIFSGMGLSDIDSYGFKIGHASTDVQVSGNCVRCGFAGVVVYGDDSNTTSRINVTSWVSDDIGSNAYWSAQNVAGVIQLDNTVPPSNFSCINCNVNAPLVTFTGTSVGTTSLTAASVTGTIKVGQTIGTDACVSGGAIRIASQFSGTPGGAGVYITNTATTCGGVALTSGFMKYGFWSQTGTPTAMQVALPIISGSVTSNYFGFTTGGIYENRTTSGAWNVYGPAATAGLLRTSTDDASHVSAYEGYVAGTRRILAGYYNAANAPSGVAGFQLWNADNTSMIFGTNNLEAGRITASQHWDFGKLNTTSGIIDIFGSSSGTITAQPQAASGTYNWNWPITAGSSGNILVSGGGSSSPMTWDTTTGSGTVVALATSPTFVTSIITPAIVGSALSIGPNNVAADSPVTIMSNTAATVGVTAGTNLHIVGADATSNIQTFDSFGAQNIFAARRANGTRASKTAVTTNDILFNINFNGWDTTDYGSAGSIQSKAAETFTASAHGAFISFNTVPTGGTSGVEAGRFTASGGLTVGDTTDPGVGLIRAKNTFVAAGITTDSTHTDATVCEDTTTHTFYSGSGAAGICLGTSGRQFKTAFAPMKEGLAELVNLPLYTFNYKPGFGDNGDHRQWGTTAQDVEKVMPAVARYNDKGEAINYDWGALIPISVHAIQQLDQKIAELKADNDNLRACQQSWKCRIFGVR